MATPKPKYDLSQIKAIVEKYVEGAKEMIYFSAPSRSLACVIEVLLCQDHEVHKIITDGILQLKDSDFSHSLFQWDTVMDVYGLENYQKNNWYIKFNLKEEDGQVFLENVSFHPPVKSLTLIDDRILLPIEDS